MTLWLAIASALWLGILTSISPCPLASNIAAISFIGRQVGKKRSVLLSGLLYTLGRTLTYVGLAVVVLAGMLASGDVARFLQRYLNQILGPVLILVGMVLLGVLGESISFNLAGEGVQQRAAKGGVWWAGALGVLFALSFCPVSAGLFFGGLLSLSAKAESRVLLPTLFGIGTAVPVIFFAFLMAFGSEYVGRAFNKLSAIEKWVRTITGTVFIVAGFYYCLRYVYGISVPA
jgi:cytochrome c-type biogenesis protein